MMISAVMEAIVVSAGNVLSRIIASRVGILVVAFGAAAIALLLWHHFDKSSAVRKAVNEFVAHAELVSLRVEKEELRRRRAVTDRANRRFSAEIQQAYADAEAAAEELADYVSTVADSCVVDADLLKRLRNR